MTPARPPAASPFPNRSPPRGPVTGPGGPRADYVSHFAPPPPPPDPGDVEVAALVAHLAAYAVGVAPHELGQVTRRSAAAARARQVAMYLAHTALSWSLGRVAAAFGRDRTTVSHACGRVEDWRDDAGFDARLGDLEACLLAIPSPRALAPPEAA